MIARPSPVVLAPVLTFLFACGGATPEPLLPQAEPEPKSARPSCDSIHAVCDPYENEEGVGKECHDMAEASTTTEAICLQRKAECMAACPPKRPETDTSPSS